MWLRMAVLRLVTSVVVTLLFFAVGTQAASAETEAEREVNIKEMRKYFSNCPLNFKFEGFNELSACIWARSAGTEEVPGETGPELAHSEFQAGKIAVALSRPILLQGGDREEGGVQEFVGPEDGVPTLKPVVQPSVILSEVINPGELPPEEQRRFQQKRNERVGVTVELAGSPGSIVLNEEALLKATEETALGLPTKVKLSSGFLGPECYVGSNSSPIVIDLVTGTSGSLKGVVGAVRENKQGNILTISGDKLVNNTYAAPGVEGCGRGGAADGALDHGLGLPSPAGANRAVIVGTLRQAGATTVNELLNGKSEP